MMLSISLVSRLCCVVPCRETVELCRRAEAAGCAWITVHGRTTKQRAEPANMDAVRTVRNASSITLAVFGQAIM